METKGDNFQVLNNLIIKVEDLLVNKFGFYSEDRLSGQILSEQKGIFRTNCLDCLDRTNVVQNKICFRLVDVILDTLKKSSKSGVSQMQQAQLSELGFP